MNPELNMINENGDVMTFTLSNINCSIANALRRTILSDIDIFCFDVTKDNGSNINIYMNTSRINNEILKHRLSCIPINISDEDFPYEKYLLEIDVENTSENIINITTDDFKIKDTDNETYLSKEKINELFPKNKITDDFILFARLRPQIGNIPGEKIKLNAKISRSCAKENGVFNVVSTSTYAATVDNELIQKTWFTKEKELTSLKVPEEDILQQKEDFLLLDAKRIITPNSFDFTVETIGIFKNTEIIKMACKIIKNNLTYIQKLISDDELEIRETDIVNDYSYDVKLVDMTHTIGKSLEYMFIEEYMEKTNKLSFCSFKKFHPHDNFSVLRLIYNEDENIGTVKDNLNNVCEKLKKLFQNIDELF